MPCPPRVVVSDKSNATEFPSTSVCQTQTGKSLEDNNSLSDDATYQAIAKLTSRVSIEGSDLLRGVNMSSVMSMLGTVLPSSADEAAEHKSKCVRRIDAFVSHNWSMGRVKKFVALAVHYNGGWALLASVLVGLLTSVLTVLGHLPVFPFHPRVPLSFNAWFFGHVTFFVVLVFGHDIRRLCRKDLTVFFDKACISQTDQERQRRGIANLAGFLQASDTMVVLYGPDYLQKLWTVYELVSYMLLHRDLSRIQLVPVFWSLLSMLFIVVLFFATAGFFVLFSVTMTLFPDMTPYIFAPIYVSCCLVYVVALSKALQVWRQVQRDIGERISNFRIQDAHCLVEVDRDLVQNNIYDFLVALGWIDAGEGVEQALERFNQAVRATLPLCLSWGCGARGLSYRTLVMAFMNFILIMFDHVAANVSTGVPIVSTLALVLYNSIQAFIVGPFGISLSAVLLGSKASSASWCQNFLALLPTLPLWAIPYTSASIAMVEDGTLALVGLIITATATLLMGAATLWACTRGSNPSKDDLRLHKGVVGPVPQQVIEQITYEIGASMRPPSKWRARIDEIGRDNFVDGFFHV